MSSLQLCAFDWHSQKHILFISVIMHCNYLNIIINYQSFYMIIVLVNMYFGCWFQQLAGVKCEN